MEYAECTGPSPRQTSQSPTLVTGSVVWRGLGPVHCSTGCVHPLTDSVTHRQTDIICHMQLRHWADMN